MTAKRHIIVEGPDGAGKDTLINTLLTYKWAQHGIPAFIRHARASTSLGGPVVNLAEWVANDIRTMPYHPPSIYNRHPLISEPIYAKYREINILQDPLWANPVWADAHRREASRHAILIFCMPGRSTVRDVVRRQGPEAHMPGVFNNISEIYADYTAASYLWPSRTIAYDYGTMSIQSLIRRIRIELENTYGDH